MYEYTVIRSKRKTMTIEITKELKVLVRCPLRLSKKQIERFIVQNDNWIETHIEKMRVRTAFEEKNSLTAEQIKVLRQKAGEVLPGRVAHYSAIMGLFPTGIKITAAEKRFGSCSGKNSLCFSYRLLQYPMAAVDYVVVHELAHIKHKNHGREFYALIEQYLPDYKKRSKMLRYDYAGTDSNTEHNDGEFV